MKYFAYNPEIEQQLKKVKKTITLSMNGITSDRMKEANITYKENFGVSIPRIKEISQNYSPNQQLAEQLWHQEIREMMILATLLYPISEFTNETANEWINDLCNEEIAQQFSSNLLLKLNIPSLLIESWLNSKKQYAIAAALLYLGKIKEIPDNQIFETLIKRIISLSKQSDIKIYHSISVCLRHISRKDKTLAKSILERIKPFENSNIFAQKYIYNEVFQEYTYIYGPI